MTTDVAEHSEFADKKRGSKIARTSEDEGWYSEDFTLDEIKTLRAKERLPEDVRTHKFDGLFQVITLDEFLQFVGGINGQSTGYECDWDSEEEDREIGVYIETKTPSHFRSLGYNMEETLLETLRYWGYEEKCIVAHETYIEDPTRWAKECGVILQSFENNLSDLSLECPYPRIQVSSKIPIE